jgi:putative ABC transport system substrate-binding protein
MKLSKIVVLALCSFVWTINGHAFAQERRKPFRIGYVSTTQGTPEVEAFRRGLHELGYVEGETIFIEHRYMAGDRNRIPGIISELLELKVDVIVTGTPPAMRALMQATKTIPIVMITTQDPVAAGYVASFARPGGNVTGLTRLTRDLSDKRLELVKELVPRVSRIGILWNADGRDLGFGVGFKRYEAAAKSSRISLESLSVRGPTPDLETAFRTAAAKHVGAVITLSNIVLDPYPEQIAELAIKHKLPSMGERPRYVDAGGLISYTAHEADLYRRAAVYVDKILKGAKPADLPVEQPTKFDLVINLKTAKQIGLTIPPNVLAGADRVIK